MKGKLQRNMNCNGISIIINGIPSERRVPASCSYIEIEDIWKITLVGIPAQIIRMQYVLISP